MAQPTAPKTPEQYMASLDDLDRPELAKLLRTAASSQPPEAADG